MIEINFLDSSGGKILSLTTIQEVNNFFKHTVNCSSPQTLLIDIMTKHYRYNLNGTEFYCHKTNIDNVNGKVTVNYDKV
jgi:hypothetical protein